MDADMGVLGADVPRFRCVRAPATYPRVTDGPVRYAAVALGDREVGYLWVADEGDAADFVPRDDAGDDALNVDVVWVARLRASRKRRDTAAEAFDYWVANGGTGGMTIGAPREAPSVEAVRAAARSKARDDAADG
jgi:hypothetical protein